jgi:hypothetical protein
MEPLQVVVEFGDVLESETGTMSAHRGCLPM